MGESVKIAIPYSVIDGVEKSSAMDFSETIEVKVIDKDEHYTIDSYFFAYFRDISSALTQIQDVIAQYQATAPLVEVTDTTQPQRATGSPHFAHIDRTTSAPSNLSHQSDASGGFKISSLLNLRPFSTTSTSTIDEAHAPKGRLSEGLPTSPSRSAEGGSMQREPGSADTIMAGTSSIMSDVSVHTYPPSPSATLQSPASNRTSVSSSWSVPGYNWLRGKRIFSSPSSNVEWGSRSGDSNVSEIVSSPNPDQSGLSASTDGGNLGFSILEASEDGKAADAGMQEKFRSIFALDEKEALLGYIPGSLFRVLPVFGRLYVSTNYFCFKSSQPLTKTRVSFFPQYWLTLVDGGFFFADDDTHPRHSCD